MAQFKHAKIVKAERNGKKKINFSCIPEAHPIFAEGSGSESRAEWQEKKQFSIIHDIRPIFPKTHSDEDNGN